MSDDNTDALKILRAQMIDLMSAYSEEHFAAGWLDSLNDDLRDRGGLWLAMAAACGGWPRGHRAEDGWDPLTPDELRALTVLLETSSTSVLVLPRLVGARQ